MRPASEPSVAAAPLGDVLERRVRALGFADAAVSPWVRARVDAFLPAMLQRLGLDPRRVRDRFPLELLAAETRCAACGETGRCRRFLAGAAGADPSPAFCPNAPLFCELVRGVGGGGRSQSSSAG
jgi:hypothetical protein